MSETAVAAPAFLDKLDASRVASRVLATATAEVKNAALRAIAEAVVSGADRILPANDLDLANARENNVSLGLQDRLRLDETRLAGLAEAVLQVASLVDPVGQSVRGSTLENGLKIAQVRVPFGVVGAIYEARPNVTIDIAALALKSGNAAVLRGGSAAENTNRVLVELLQEAIASVGLPAESVQTIDEFGREGARQLMRARGYIDVLIPRGSADLINTVVAMSRSADSSRPVRVWCTCTSTSPPTSTLRSASCRTPRCRGPACATRSRRCSCTNHPLPACCRQFSDACARTA